MKLGSKYSPRERSYFKVGHPVVFVRPMVTKGTVETTKFFSVK
jgi:hypothetical protein